MSKRTGDFIIRRNRRLDSDFFVLDIEGITDPGEFRPGQFVQVRVDRSTDTFLRRPISVYDVDVENNLLSLFIQVAGKGTASLYNLESGDTVNIMYPLGSSFSMPDSQGNILLVGGGVGIAPLFFLGKELVNKGFSPDFLLGFRSISRMHETDKFRSLGNLYITTEDASYGEKGFVTGHSILTSKKYDRIYCCGPEPMMKAVASYSRINNILCEVSLENLMACGFGVCLCCIAETVRGNLCTCTDGPVFNIKDLKW